MFCEDEVALEVIEAFLATAVLVRRETGDGLTSIFAALAFDKIPVFGSFELILVTLLIDEGL